MQIHEVFHIWGEGFPGSVCNVGDLGSIPGLGRSPEGRRGNLLRILAWRIPMDRGAWWATLHGVSKELDVPERLSRNTLVIKISCFIN